MRQVLCCGIALCVASCKDVRTRVIVLPVALHAQAAEVLKDLPRLKIKLGSDGRIRIDAKTFCFDDPALRKRVFGDATLVSVSLNELDEHLHGACRLLDLLSKRRGVAAIEDVGTVRVRRLVALLHVDRDVPAVHVQWVISALGKALIYRVELAVTRVAGKDYTTEQASELGVAKSKHGKVGDPVRLFVPIPVRGDEEPDLGAVGVGPPSKVEDQKRDLYVMRRGVKGRFKVSESSAMGIKELARVLRQRQTELRKKEVVAVGMDDDVAFKFVVAALDQLHAHGVKNIDWSTGAAPSRVVSAAPRLPAVR